MEVTSRSQRFKGQPDMAQSRLFPKGYGGTRPDPETVKREGWRTQGLLVIAANDDRLTWPERQFIQLIGDRLYGENT